MDFSAYKKIVIKIGSSLLMGDGKTSLVRQDWLLTLASDIADLKKKSHQLLLVTSGAAALGRMIGKQHKNQEEEIGMKQAASAIGQGPLMSAWQNAFASHDILVAQILLTPRDTEERHRHLHARTTIETLLAMGVIPIINENDSVAVDELKYGDNDRLSARVASMVSADLLILLSDVDGLYDKNPQTHQDARHIPHVKIVDSQIEKLAKPAHSNSGTGGMVTKIAAAKLATKAGVDMVIASGLDAYPLTALQEQKKKATLFNKTTTPLVARKKWIAGLLHHEGEITIDNGALKAMVAGRSLLPAGVKNCHQSFEKGAVILLKNEKGKRLGVGLINHDSDDVIKMMGKKSSEINKIFSKGIKIELIDRDNLVIDSDLEE